MSNNNEAAEHRRALCATLERLGATPMTVNGVPTGFGILRCTPEKATQLLSLSAERQRNIDRAHVDRIANAHAAGRYVFTGDPVRFTLKGEGVDGQHRLTAIVKSGVTLDVIVCIVPDEAFLVIDANTKSRSLMQLAKLNIARNIHSSVISAVLQEHEGLSGQPCRLSKDEKIRTVSQYEFLEQAIELHATNTGKKPTAGLLAGALRCVRFSPTQAMKFFKAAFHNEHAIDGDRCTPAKELATYMYVGAKTAATASTTHMLQREDSARAIHAFNAYVDGRELRMIKGSVAGIMPEPRASRQQKVAS